MIVGRTNCATSEWVTRIIPPSRRFLVGDANGLKKAAEQVGLSVGEDALTPSLFAGLAQDRSGVNLLIGSRRFAEGWDNYRASSLTLLRLGQGEGALIIQMFGRVVRFAGRHSDGKRLDSPLPELRPLQTAYVYGLRSTYLEIFLNGLYANGVVESRPLDCPTRLNLPDPSPLKTVVAIAPPRQDFTVEASGDGWLAGINPVTLVLGATVTTTTLSRAGVDHAQGLAGHDITTRFRQRLPLLDRDWLWRELVEFKRLRGWWNFRFDRAAIEAALHSNRYRIVGLPAVLEVRDEADLQRFNRLAATLLRRLFENAYRKQESRHCRYALDDAASSSIPRVYHKDPALNAFRLMSSKAGYRKPSGPIRKWATRRTPSRNSWPIPPSPTMNPYSKPPSQRP